MVTWIPFRLIRKTAAHWLLTSWPSTRMAAMRCPAFPFHRACVRGGGGGASNTSQAALTIRSAFRPTRRFVPLAMVMGRSVLSRSVRHGTRSTVVSSCTPPESVRTSRADASSAMKSRYPVGGMTRTLSGSPASISRPAARGWAGSTSRQWREISPRAGGRMCALPRDNWP
jgi:hypothetical protein